VEARIVPSGQTSPAEIVEAPMSTPTTGSVEIVMASHRWQAECHRGNLVSTVGGVVGVQAHIAHPSAQVRKRRVAPVRSRCKLAWRGLPRAAGAAVTCRVRAFSHKGQRQGQLARARCRLRLRVQRPDLPPELAEATCGNQWRVGRPGADLRKAALPQRPKPTEVT
jgi:hypothetical protein